MKVLFVSTSIPPETDMQTTRNIYLIEAFLKAGHSVDILTCGDYSRGQSSFDSILDRTKIYRTDFPCVFKWHSMLTKKCPSKFLLKVHNVAINYYAVPDMYTGWEKMAIKCIKENNLYDYDILVSSSGSFTAHFVGKKWKEMTGKKWIAEYGDPWGLDSFGNVRKINYMKEQPLLSICDGLIFTTQATIDAYKKHYKNQLPYELVPCGYTEPIIDGSKDDASTKLLFTYTGMAFKRGRNLSEVIEVAKDTPVMDFMMVGTISDALRADCAGIDNVICKGRVPYQESLRIIGYSDVMVHIGNFGTMQVPGKTYIYLSSAKPILYIQQQMTDDPTLQVLKQFEGVVVSKNTKEDIDKAIKYIIENYKDLKAKSEIRCKSALMKCYSWEQLGSKFVKFTEKCANNV